MKFDSLFHFGATAGRSEVSFLIPEMVGDNLLSGVFV